MADEGHRAVEAIVMVAEAPVEPGLLAQLLDRIDRVRGASVNFTYAILRAADETLLCEGETELACIDLRTAERRPCLMPDSLRLGFEA